MPATIFDAATRRAIKAMRLHFGRSLAADGGSTLRSQRVGHGGEFHEHRDYLQGDDPRHIDWNLYGRMGELYVKRFRSEADLELRILVDDSESMALGESSKRVLALRLAATLATLLQPMARDLDFRILTEDALPLAEPNSKGLASEALFAALEALEPGQTACDLNLARSFMPTQRNRLVFLISDFLDDSQDLSRLLASRSARTDLVLVAVMAAEELEFDAVGLLDFIDAETGEQLVLAVNQTLIDEYRRQMAKRLELLEGLAAKHAASFVLIPSHLSLVDAFERVMRRGGLGR